MEGQAPSDTWEPKVCFYCSVTCFGRDMPAVIEKMIVFMRNLVEASILRCRVWYNSAGQFRPTGELKCSSELPHLTVGRICSLAGSSSKASLSRSRSRKRRKRVIGCLSLPSTPARAGGRTSCAAIRGIGSPKASGCGIFPHPSSRSSDRLLPPHSLFSHGATVVHPTTVALSLFDSDTIMVRP